MASEKPLHVRVAEALGCQLRWQEQTPVVLGGYWRCGCAEFQKHGGLLDVLRYDIDWAATGPLIEKYGFDIYQTATWQANYSGYGGEGNTALVAVCRLILELAKNGKINGD